MAKSQTEDNDNDHVDIVDKIFTWIICGWLIVLFKIIAFIFWRNKYAKEYWEKRKEWRKTKRKLRSKALKDIIVSTILPKLKEYGYEPKPKAWWGWCGMIHSYNYEAVRLEGNELRYFEILASSRENYIAIATNIYILDPVIPKSVAEIGEYTIDIVYNFEKRDKTRQLYSYLLKNFRSQKQLDNKCIPKMKSEIENDMCDINVFNQKFYGDFYTEITPEVVDLIEEKALNDEADRKWAEEERKRELRRQRRRELKEQRESKQIKD